MEKHQIYLKSQLIEYQVTYKKMKNIRIKADNGIIQVSAPYQTPISYIEELIISHQDKLLSLLNQYIPYYHYEDQGFVYIFNQKYNIIVRDISKNQCTMHDHQLYVYTHQVQKCVEAYLKEVLMNYIQNKIIDYLAYDYHLPMPIIQIRKYKGRWGSCFYKDNKVTFNLSLVHLSSDLIDYVIIHELTHFIYPNHSSQFYNEIGKHMPDYKQRIQRLKEEHV